MNIVDQKVVHSLYNEGTVVDQQENKLTIRFSGKIGEKIFIYPDAFEKFLKLTNLEAETSMLGELKAKQVVLKAKILEEQKVLEAAKKSKKAEKPKAAPRKKKVVAKSETIE